MIVLASKYNKIEDELNNEKRINKELNKEVQRLAGLIKTAM